MTDNITSIEIYPEDEITILDRKDLKKMGYGSTSTIDRKMKKGFPKPVIDDGGKRGWTVAQIKRYLLEKFNQQVAV